MGIAETKGKRQFPAIVLFIAITFFLPKDAFGFELPLTPPAKITQVSPDRRVEIEVGEQKFQAKLAGIEPLKDSSDLCIEEKALEDTKELLEDVTVTVTDAVPTMSLEKSVDLFLVDGTHLNTELVAMGLARKQVSAFYPTKYDNEFAAAEALAMEKKVGLWAPECTQDNTELTLVASDESLTPIETETIIQTSSDQAVMLKPQVETVEIIPTPTPLPIYIPPEPVASETADASLNMQLSASPESLPMSHNSENIFAMINEHRAKIGKPAFIKDERICSVAISRGPEIYNEIFVNRNMHAGFFARNLPFWATENVASYQTEAQVMGFWLRSPVHRSAIEGDYTHSCGACYGNSCAQIFTNFTPKV